MVRRAAARSGFAAGAVLGLVSLTLVACTPAPAATTTADAASTTAAEPDTATTTPTPTETVAPTCESIVPADFVERAAEYNWTAQQRDFTIDSITVPDGLWCVWGDYSIATDNVAIYGWAPITDQGAAEARAELLANGWQLIEDAGGDYFTVDPSFALQPDSDGYGMTYRFGDGWVIVSDTKQGLSLIQIPNG